MSDKSTNKVTSTPMDRSNQMRPPVLDHNASRILGYEVFRRADRSTTTATARTLNDPSNERETPSNVTSSLTPAEERRVLWAKYLQSAYADAKAAQRLKRKREQMKDTVDALTGLTESLVEEVRRLQKEEIIRETRTVVQEVIDFHLDSGLMEAQRKLHEAMGPCEAFGHALTASMTALKVSDDVILDSGTGLTVQETFSSLLQSVESILASAGDDDKFVETVTSLRDVIGKVSDGISGQTDDLNQMVQDMSCLARLIHEEACLKMFLE